MPVLRLPSLLLLAFLLMLTRGVAEVAAESGSAQHPALTNLLVPDYFESQIIAVTNRTDLSEEIQSAAIQLLNQSISMRTEWGELEAEQARLLKVADDASNQLYQANQALSAPIGVAEVGVEPGSSAKVFEQRVSEVRAEVRIAEAERSRLDGEPKRRADRKVKIAELLAEYRGTLNDLEKPLSQRLDGSIPEEFSEAFEEYTLLQKAVYLRRIRNLNLEMASYDATSELLLAQQALASRRVQLLEDQLVLLKQATSDRRTDESETAAREAETARRRAEALELSEVTALANANQAIARSRVEVSSQLQEASQQLDEIEAEWKAIQTSFDSVQEQVQTVQDSGFAQNFAIGLALRREQYSLPSMRRQELEIRERREQMARAQLDLLGVSERQRQEADIEKHLLLILNELPPDMPSWQQQEAIAECRRLLQEQRGLLGDLSADYSSLVGTLAKLSRVQEQYLNTIEEFRGYISERVLWIQSTDRLSLSGVRKEVDTIRRVLGQELKDGLWPYLHQDARRHFSVYLGAGLILLALLAARLPLRKGLRLTCPDRMPEGRLSLRPASLALLYTAILSIPIPAALIFLGWRLEGHTGTTELAEQWTHAFYVLGAGVTVMEFTRQACRSPGLALAHLRWPLHNVKLVRFHFTWFLAVGVPMGLLTDLLEGVFVEGVSNRLMFMLGQCLILMFGHWMLRPQGGLRFNRRDGEAGSEGPLRFQRFYHLLALAIPACFIVMSALGYTYTARSIWMRVGDSIQWGIVVLLATLLILHWLTVMRRKLAVKKAELRKSLEDDKEAQEQAGPDIWQVYSASRRLFTTLLWIVMAIGLWVIWSDMLPALRRLDRTPVPFFSRTTAVHYPSSPNLMPPGVSGGVPQAGDGEGEESSAVQSVPFGQKDFVSVADLFLALVVLLLTIAGSRHLPGFVQMVLLSRVRFRQGEGYAIVTVLRYTVLLVGLGWALTLIGITWNKVQWLAAAITVGIGFGLQEIFANFVSGLILLFERPVRVGDVITAGNVTGSVTRIQMRATTIRNWDQQELVIPNKDLITGQVINWTLSNDVSRLALTVGVSYDADVSRASKLLLEIAKQNPNVVRDPAPFVTFEEFADSTLNLVLRAYVSIEVRLSTKSAMNNAILEQFREAGIEIAYPQRDLHLRSVADDLPALPPVRGGDPDSTRS
jgi:potassium efflux system protein